MNTNCHDCGHTVRRGDAYIRSISFKQVAFHPACWQVRTAVDAVFADPSVVVAGHAGSRLAS